MLKCDACGLCQTAKNVRIEGWGAKNASIMVVSGKPSKDDDKDGKALQGKTGTYLKTLLRTAGINLNDCFFTSAIKCFSDGDNKEADKTASSVCPDRWLFKEIQIIKPKVIVALGNDAYQIVSGNKSVDKDRGSLVIRDFGPISCYVIPIYSPYFLMQQSDKSKNVKQTIEDLRKIPNILNGSFGMWNDSDLNNGKLDYQVIDTVTKLQGIVQDVYKAGVLAADIECRKLDPYRVSFDCVGEGYPFVSLQMSYMEGQAFLIPWANVEFQSDSNKEGFFFSEEDRVKIKEILKELLEDPQDKITLVGHNFKFDSKWIMRWLGITPRLDYDTMVAASFLGEASNRLKKIAWHWTPMGGYETKQDEFTQQLPVEDRWDMFKYPLDVLVPYGCADADATLRIYNQFVKKGIVNPSNQRVFDIIVTASRVFADIENDGIHIDTPYLAKLKEDLTLDLKRVEEEFRMEAFEDIEFLNKQIYEESLGKKGKPLKHKNTEFIISSNDHISRLFYGRLGMEINEQHRSKKTQDASTGSAALKELAPKYPIAGKLLEWRKISKQISGFVDAYPSFIDFQDRIHPTYSLVQYETDSGDESGTITGRTSCSDPNLQQVPSRGDGKKIKKLFIPDCPDHLIVDFDFAGIELRVAAMHSQDNIMKDFFNSGKGDFHTYAASKIYNVEESAVIDKQRTTAKTFNFCVPMNTQALTVSGFKNYDELSIGDSVFGLDPKDKKVKLTKILNIAKFEDTPFIELSNNHFSVITTPEHRWYGRERKSARRNGIPFHYEEEKFFSTKEIKSEHTLLLSAPALMKKKLNLSEDECEIIGWVLGDGRVDCAPVTGRTSQSFGNKRQTNVWIFQSKNKPTHLSKLRLLLRGLPFTSYNHNDLMVSFKACGSYGRDLWTRANLYSKDYTSFVLSLSTKQLDRFLTGFFLAEGYYDNRGHKIISQNSGSVLDAVQLAIFLSGYLPSKRSHKSKSYVYKKEKNKKNHNFTVRYSKPYVTGQRLRKKSLPSGPSWCIQTELGTWVMKQGDTICVTGNCLLYGGGPQKVASITGCSLAEADSFVKEYFKVFPSLQEWIKGQHRFAKMYGYVKSMFGRIRHLPDAQLDTRDFGNKIKMEAALKRAVNSVIQSDASDLTLYSLGRIWEYLNKYEHSDPKWPSRLRGSVHDSILMSVHVNDLPDIVSHIKAEILENPQLDFIVSKGVSLRADCSIGPNWGEQKDLEFGE